MKILITTDWYKPVVNGVVTSVINLTRGLEADGHEVRILTLSDKIFSRKEGNVYYIGSLGAGAVYPNARIMLLAGHEYVQELIDWKPDVIHSQCEFSSFVLARKISKRTNAPIVHTYHTVYEGYTHYFCPKMSWGKRLVEFFTRKIANRSKAFIVPSKKIENMLDTYNISAPMYVVPTGIELNKYIDEDEEKRNFIRKKYGIRVDECVLIYAGRLAKEKNIEEILSYMTDERTENIRLLVAGDGPYRNVVEEEVKRLELEDRVIFAGMIKPEQMADFYKAGDIFVSASTSETQGLTYMEAMASGLSMLCRYDKCLDGVVTNGVTGYTYYDKDEFVEYLLKLKQNKRLRDYVGFKAKELMIKKFSIHSFVRSCEKVYEQCVA